MLQMNDATTRLLNTKNRNQGPFRKVLAVCSAGLLRSPSIAHVVSLPPYNCNARACGSSKEYALVLLDRVLVEWADIIICANDEQVKPVMALVAKCSDPTKEVVNLNLPDSFKTRSRPLMYEIHKRLQKIKFTGTPKSAISRTIFDLEESQQLFS